MSDESKMAETVDANVSRKRKASPRKKKTGAAPAIPSKALALMSPVERASTLLRFDERKEHLKELVKRSERITTITNVAGLDECHSARMALKSTRIAIQKVGKDAREDATAFSKAVIAKEKELIAITDPEEKRLEVIQDTWESARKEEQQAKLRIEAERIKKENDALEAIRNLPLAMVSKSSKEIGAAMDDLFNRDLAAEFDEDALERANEIRGAAVLKLKDLAIAAHDREELQKQLDEERANRAREQAEQAARDAQRDRDAEAERARQAAEQKARDDAEKVRRAKEDREREHIADIRNIPTKCIGMSVAQLDREIEDAHNLNPAQVIEPGDSLELALDVREKVIAQLQLMRDSQVQAEKDRKERLDREAAERAQAEEAAAAERQRAHDARMAELKASAPPLPVAALRALQALEPDSDIAIELQFAVERDCDVMKRLLDAIEDLYQKSNIGAMDYDELEERIQFARDYIKG